MFNGCYISTSPWLFLLGLWYKQVWSLHRCSVVTTYLHVHDCFVRSLIQAGVIFSQMFSGYYISTSPWLFLLGLWYKQVWSFHRCSVVTVYPQVHDCFVRSLIQAGVIPSQMFIAPYPGSRWAWGWLAGYQAKMFSGYYISANSWLFC